MYICLVCSVVDQRFDAVIMPIRIRIQIRLSILMPDPDRPGLGMPIPIRTRQNDANPTGFGSTALRVWVIYRFSSK
jgi:hypothetical protein